MTANLTCNTLFGLSPTSLYLILFFYLIPYTASSRSSTLYAKSAFPGLAIGLYLFASKLEPLLPGL